MLMCAGFCVLSKNSCVGTTTDCCTDSQFWTVMLSAVLRYLIFQNLDYSDYHD